jgi:hypothetical protein
VVQARCGERSPAAGIVIGVTIRPPRGEAEVIRSEQAAENVSQVLNLFLHGPVSKAKALNCHATKTQPIERNPGLNRTSLCEIPSQSARPWVGSLTVGDRHHHRLDTNTIHVLEQTTGPEDLVIGVRSHDNQPAGSPQVQRTEHGELSRFEPGSLICSRVQVIDD